MFTGIIEATAPILAVSMHESVRRTRIKKPDGWKLVPGQSVAVDGVCSTIRKQGETFFEVEYMQETLSKTTVASFVKNKIVNLERSLTLKDRIDGHMVQGHVDVYSRVVGVTEGDAVQVTMTVPSLLMRCIATHGSIAINGVSLTTTRVHGNMFSVALIPYTIMHTNLGLLKKGDIVNVEVDTLARYVVAALARGVTVKHYAKKRIHKKD